MTESKLVTIRVPDKKRFDRIDRKTLTVQRVEKLPEIENVGSGTVTVFLGEDGKVYVERLIDRNRVRNIIDQYESIENNSIVVRPLTLDIANQIVDKVLENKLSYNACFVFGDVESRNLNWTKSEEEHKFTSTGIKFWRHQQAMLEYRKLFDGFARNTVVSTHVSPEGKCNLSCSYCSVTYRDTHSRIPLERIQKYVIDLKSRGLKAVILTGGGEPTLYPEFNDLVRWLKHDQGLSVALITNGTTGKKINSDTLNCFSWIRVSINVFPGWEEQIALDTKNLNSSCIVGCSMVYTVEHEARSVTENDRLKIFKSVSKIADKIDAKYIRLLPNCLLEQDRLLLEHKNLQELVTQLNDTRYFQQYKIHGAPSCSTCHQSYFRPYLSEEPFHLDGEPGTVYPCDSVVLNDSVTHFAQKYQICKPENILDYIDGKIKHEFNPKRDCTGCVFTENVNMLDKWLVSGENRFDEFSSPLVHEEFV